MADIIQARVTVTQTGADTYTAEAFTMPYLAEKQGIEVVALEAYWANSAGIAAADCSLIAGIATQEAVAAWGDDELVSAFPWAAVSGAGSLHVAKVGETLLVPRVTVQPYIYAQVSSTATAQANIVSFGMFYRIVKLSEVEYYRLLAGGA